MVLNALYNMTIMASAANPAIAVFQWYYFHD
jgi:hypothetical protein